MNYFKLQTHRLYEFLLKKYITRKRNILYFPSEDACNILVVCEDREIPMSQAYAYYYHKNIFKKYYDIHFDFVSNKLIEESPNIRINNNIDLVLFQTNFDWEGERLLTLINRLKNICPNARLIYLDWFAPTDLRYANLLDEHISLYFKKYLLKDTSYYGKPTIGHTNLSDYYSHKFNIQDVTTTFHVPENFFEKICTGPSFELASTIIPYFDKFPDTNIRPIDLHARIATKGTPWYTKMREEALKATKNLNGFKVANQGRVSRRNFLNEMYQSKMCFSPFGYGEVCWRDFEAIMTGSLLIKPDCSHLHIEPDIFVAGETYVPVKWDLSDLEDKITYYSKNTSQIEAITKNAFNIVKDYLSNNMFVHRFVKDLTKMDKFNG